MNFPQEEKQAMDTQELYRRGLAVRKQMFGADAVDKRMAALGEFGAPLQQMINAYAYGDVWSRAGLERKIRSLVVLGMNAAINRAAEFKVHVNGALNNGCTPDEIREVCLLVALYAGIPAANDAHRLALEVFRERGIDV
jgi:4-carboxymuconolactone decarboxylase